MDDKINDAFSTEDADIVLVIDPDKTELDIVYRDLQTLGYPSITVESLEEGINSLKTYRIVVVICSYIQTNDVSGIELLKHMAANFPETERILLTPGDAIDSIPEIAKNAPLFSFLQKPWDLSRLQYTIERALEKNRLIKENLLLQQKLLKQHVSMAVRHKDFQDEMTLGGDVHKKMLFGTIPQDIPGFRAAASSLSSLAIEGDYLEFMLPTQTTIDLFIGNVIGKGIPVALVSTAIKTQLIRFGMPSTRSQVLKKERIWEEDLFTPEEILERVHRELIDQLIHFEYCSTLFYARFYLHKRIMKFIDCGFSKPLHYIVQENRISLLRGNNPPLGMSFQNEYKSQSIHFAPGDFFVFYSQTVLEAKNLKGEEFGIDRLIEAAYQYRNCSPEELTKLLSKTVSEFIQSEHPENDMTIVAISITHENLLEGEVHKTAKFKTDLSQLPAVRDFVYRSCIKAPGDSQQLSEQMQLAINEIFCNIVKHGFNTKSIGEIVLKVGLEERGIRFEIADQGPSFNPDEIREPSLAGDRFEGFGWYMVKKIVDEVVYLHKQVEEGWNHLELYKSYILEEETMEIGQINENDIMIITPKISSLDAKDVSEFKEKVMDTIQNKNPEGLKRFILDLKQIEFIDSSGLGSFLSILRYLRDHGSSLKLANMNTSVRTIFELVSMHKVFETYGTLEEAKNSFKK